MKAARWWALIGSTGLTVSLIAAMAGPAVASTSATPPPNRTPLHGSLTPAQARSHPAGSVAANSSVSFDLVLSLQNASGAQAFLRDVSSPGSATFHQYLTDAQWVSQFGPTQAEVAAAESWLRQEGLTVGSVPKDRLYVPASGSAQNVERAFGVTLGYYMVNGHKVRLAQSTLTIPSSLASTVSGAVGVNQNVMTTSQEPAPPAGFRNPQPCSAYWGQKIDTKDSATLYAPYTAPLPYDICGYKPAQLRGAYQLAGSVASGNDGSGVTIAIVDAYDSPTLLSDAQTYFRLNDPSHPLNSSQFTNVAAGDRRRRGRVCRQRLVRRAGAGRGGLALDGARGEHPVRRGAGLPGHEPARGGEHGGSRAAPPW